MPMKLFGYADMRYSQRRLFLRDEQGATAAEFAVLAPAFCALVFAVIEVGRLMFVGASVQYAIDRAARLAITDPDATEAQIQAKVAEYLTAAGSPTVDVDMTTQNFGAIPVRRITAHYDHTVYGPFISGFSIGFDFETLVPQPDV
jgi:Flp pilus assembly protein TadG